MAVQADVSDFKKADLKKSGSSWKSGRSGINTIAITYEVTETTAGNIIFMQWSKYFNLQCRISMTAADGRTREIVLRDPEKSESWFDVERVTKKVKISPQEAGKFIIMKSIEKIPSALESRLKNEL